MKVDEFIRKYNSSKNKDDFLDKCIITQYIPYHEKMSDCDMIVIATTKTEQGFRINSPMRFVLFIVTLINRYTKIGEDEEILSVFETLDENNLLDLIVSKIPKKEYESYQTILNMVLDDYMENSRSILAYIDNKINELKIPFKALVDVINNNVPQNVSEVAETEE